MPKSWMPVGALFFLALVCLKSIAGPGDSVQVSQLLRSTNGKISTFDLVVNGATFKISDETGIATLALIHRFILGGSWVTRQNEEGSVPESWEHLGSVYRDALFRIAMNGGVDSSELSSLLSWLHGLRRKNDLFPVIAVVGEWTKYAATRRAIFPAPVQHVLLDVGFYSLFTGRKLGASVTGDARKLGQSYGPHDPRAADCYLEVVLDEKGEARTVIRSPSENTH